MEYNENTPFYHLLATKYDTGREDEADRDSQSAPRIGNVANSPALTIKVNPSLRGALSFIAGQMMGS